MERRCRVCTAQYDDARCTTICPHEPFLTLDQAAQKDLAMKLLGKDVLFAHRPAGMLAARVVAVVWDGMVELDGWTGQFAPHLFVVAD